MKSFKDFGIEPSKKALIGTKVPIDVILNKEIIIESARVVNSKYDGLCLHLQIVIEKNRHVVFTGSKSLMDLIQQVPEGGYPFKATITKENRQYRFE